MHLCCNPRRCDLAWLDRAPTAGLGTGLGIGFALWLRLSSLSYGVTRLSSLDEDTLGSTARPIKGFGVYPCGIRCHPDTLSLAPSGLALALELELELES